MKALFHTNVDAPSGLQWRFPTEVCCKPEVGDYVDGGQLVSLKVCRVTHKEFLGGSPYLLIELTRG